MASNPFSLNLNNIVNVSVQISPILPAPPTFNEGLIIGSSTVIPSWGGTNPRLRQYTSTTAMLADGFTTSSPEYIAATMYFAQTPHPPAVWVGRQDASGTSIQTVTPVAISEGTGYVVGDVVTINGGIGGSAQVTTLGSNGAVTGLQLLHGGTGYAAGMEPTTGGTGTGLQVTITVGIETAAQAAAYCRAAGYTWYGLYMCNISDIDIQAVANWAQGASPLVFFFFNSSTSSIPTSSTTDVFSQLKGETLNHSMGIYSTNQAGLYPNNVYSGAALMGSALGMNTGLAGSYYTMKFKTLAEVAPEPLSQTSVTYAEQKNANLVVIYNNVYTILEQGVTCSGQFFDEVIFIDVICGQIQINVMNLLVANPSIPQTDPGETQLIHAVNLALEQGVLTGFIAPGIWEGPTILNLTPGTNLPKGYTSQAAPYSTQSPGDRAARKAMPIYSAIIEAGAVHSIVVGVFVQR